MTIKLLAVDDSKTMRRVLEITFSGEEFQTTLAEGADDALSVIDSDPPQVAVIDGYLAGQSGYDLCREIKARAPGVQCVLLSSKQRPFDPTQANQSGVDDHFDKPFDSGKFIDKIKQVAEEADAAPKPVAAPTPAAAPAAPVAPQAATPKPAPAAPKPAAVSAAPTASRAPQRPQAPPAKAAAEPPRIAAPVAKPAPQEPPRPPAAAPAERGAASAAMAAVSGDLESKLQQLGLTSAQMEGVLALSREVVEQVVWEVVPALAETMIKEEIARLTAE